MLLLLFPLELLLLLQRLLLLLLNRLLLGQLLLFRSLLLLERLGPLFIAFVVLWRLARSLLHTALQQLHQQRFTAVGGFEPHLFRQLLPLHV